MAFFSLFCTVSISSCSVLDISILVGGAGMRVFRIQKYIRDNRSNVSERRGGWGASSSPLPAAKSTRAATYGRTPAACTATTTTILSSPPPPHYQQQQQQLYHTTTVDGTLTTTMYHTTIAPREDRSEERTSSGSLLIVRTREYLRKKNK